MLVVMVGLLSGGLWWEGWGDQEQPGAAQGSPGEAGELWSRSGGAQGDPEHLKHDTFPGNSGSQVSPCKPRLPSPRAP